MATTPASASAIRNNAVTHKSRIITARLFHTGSQGAALAADFNNTTPGATTEIYVAEMYVPAPSYWTGLSIFNGSDVTDNVKLGLYDSLGQIIASTASTAGSGADAYQRVPFAWEFITSLTAATAIVAPLILQSGTYFAAVDFAGTTSRFQTFSVGNFGAGKITGAVFATAMISTSLTLAVPTTFTTVLGPVISGY